MLFGNLSRLWISEMNLAVFFSSFQADRFYWTYPAVWYIILAYVLYFITILWSGRCLFTIGKIVNIVLIFFVGMNVWNNSNVQINWNKLVDSDYSKVVIYRGMIFMQQICFLKL